MGDEVDVVIGDDDRLMHRRRRGRRRLDDRVFQDQRLFLFVIQHHRGGRSRRGRGGVSVALDRGFIFGDDPADGGQNLFHGRFLRVFRHGAIQESTLALSLGASATSCNWPAGAGG
jgi:hypothetical protein